MTGADGKGRSHPAGRVEDPLIAGRPGAQPGADSESPCASRPCSSTGRRRPRQTPGERGAWRRGRTAPRPPRSSQGAAQSGGALGKNSGETALQGGSASCCLLMTNRGVRHTPRTEKAPQLALRVIRAGPVEPATGVFPASRRTLSSVLRAQSPGSECPSHTQHTGAQASDARKLSLFPLTAARGPAHPSSQSARSGVTGPRAAGHADRLGTDRHRFSGAEVSLTRTQEGPLGFGGRGAVL